MSNTPKLSIKDRLAASAAKKGSRAPEVPQPPPSSTDADAIDIDVTTVPPVAAASLEAVTAGDIDVGFDAIERKTNRSPAVQGRATVDLTEVRKLFAEIAEGHMRQVSDFVIELRWGTATVEWIAICEPAVQSLRRAAENLDLVDLCIALDGFMTALQSAALVGSHTIEPAERGAILEQHAELVRILPQAFAVDDNRTAREAVIIQALLAQLTDVKKVTIDRLYAAGLTSLERIFLATPEDIAAATGIEPGVACRIVEHFRAYRDASRKPPDAGRERERTQLAELALTLQREIGEHDRAAAEWSAEALSRKKELRQARARTLLDLEIALARLGEMDLIRTLERAPFEQKVATLDAYLEKWPEAPVERNA